MNYDTINDAVTRAGGAGTLLANRYRIVRQLGQGGMGSVWLAEDTQLDNKQFAVKMLPSILVSNKRAYRQLKDEALVAMQLVHPNIVQIRAFEENSGNPFLVMDYVDGQTLDDYIADKGTLTEDETMRLLKPVAAALDYAHGEGVVHRDVKPANVMIRKDGRPFVLDFGIAREMQETMTRVTGKFSSGTLLYMSPEQLNGEPPAAAQDVYSFAAMVYECLKGEPPFIRGQIEYQILNNPPPPLPQGIVSWLSEITMRGLAKKANERPATCCEILGDVLTGGMIVADNIRLQTQIAIKAFQEDDYEKVFAAAQKADTNNAEIQFIIGWCYQFGDGVEVDYNLAMQWYHKAAVQGHLEALLGIGQLYIEKIGDPYSEWQENEYEEFKVAFDMALNCVDARVKHVFADLYVCCNYGGGRGYGLEEQIKIDEVTSLELIKESANGGYAEAQYQLGRRYEEGHGISQDYCEAVKWYRKAAERGTQEQYAGAQEKLGEMYKKGLGVVKNYDEAIKWYRKAVESSDTSRNVYNLARMYDIAKKYSDAVTWYRKAAERGHCEAQCRLGDLCRTGCGTDRDGKEAVKWDRKAAEQDNARAQYLLALSLMVFNRLTWSGETMEWLRKSAENGYGDAQHQLASIYAKGDEEASVAMDATESARWYKLAEQSYRKASESGNISAQYNLGVMYYEGEGVVQDFKEAFKWLSKAATRGSIGSQYYLGNCFARGQGVSQNFEEAVRWYRKAAERGGAKAQCALGAMYKKGHGVAQDYKEALEWFLKAAEQFNDEACYELGCMYKEGVGVEQDYMKAVKWYQKASSHNGAEYNLGLMYENGYGVKVDYNEARKYYTFAALRGNLDAQYKVGIMHFCGKGVKRDQSEALDWMRKAAEQGHVKAQQCLGEWYANWCDMETINVPRDYVESFKWHKKAAEQGDELSQYRLGEMYYKGLGVAQNYAEALKVFRKFADRRSDAKFYIGMMYRNGEGVEQNYGEAIKWLQKAAPLWSDAAYELGVMYEKGIGIHKNLAEAIDWYRKAAASGQEKATSILEKMKEDAYGTNGATNAVVQHYEDTLVLPGGQKIEMIYCQPGEFLMGSPLIEELRALNEMQHKVEITNGFWLGKYPITQEQWECVMGSNPSHPKGKNCPVHYISWYDCQEFIKRLNHIIGCQSRLPTEAEWEYACRAGTRTMFYWGNVFDGSQASCRGLYGSSKRVCGCPTAPTPVDRYAPNAWGFYDMSGNMGEWCEDWYSENKKDATYSLGPSQGASKVFRGGCIVYEAARCRSASRDSLPPDVRDFAIGFRLCCSAE